MAVSIRSKHLLFIYLILSINEMSMGPCADTLVGLAAKRDVDVRYGHKLVRIDAEQQQAFLQVRGAQLLARQNVQHHTPIQDQLCRLAIRLKGVQAVCAWNPSSLK